MFTYQSPQINQALWLSGLSNQSVSAFQNLVGQCRAPLVHRGPITFDYTRPEMRLITPESRVGKTPFEDPFQPPQNFPEQPEEDPLEPEMPPGKRKGPFLPPEHAPFDPPEMGNDGPARREPDNHEYTAGPYIKIDNKVVSLRANDIRRHCVFPNGKNVNNHVGSIDFKAKSTRPEIAELSIKDNRFDTTFTLDIKASFVEIRYAKIPPSGPPPAPGSDTDPAWEPGEGSFQEVTLAKLDDLGTPLIDESIELSDEIVIAENRIMRAKKYGWLVVGRLANGKWILIGGALALIGINVVKDVAYDGTGIHFSLQKIRIPEQAGLPFAYDIETTDCDPPPA